MTIKLVLRPEAELDMEEAALWYEVERQGLGDRFVSELSRLFVRITESPRQFPVVEEGARRGLLHRFPYAVYFLLEEDTATVLAVIHQRRHPDRWKRRL
jgi:plasmid stabilization system protein ParE